MLKNSKILIIFPCSFLHSFSALGTYVIHCVETFRYCWLLYTNKRFWSYAMKWKFTLSYYCYFVPLWLSIYGWIEQAFLSRIRFLFPLMEELLIPRLVFTSISNFQFHEVCFYLFYPSKWHRVLFLPKFKTLPCCLDFFYD